jgi:hypothetical protein
MDTSIAAPQGARETLTLSRTQVDMEPGGPEEEVVITLFNTSDVVEQ